MVGAHDRLSVPQVGSFGETVCELPVGGSPGLSTRGSRCYAMEAPLAIRVLSADSLGAVLLATRPQVTPGPTLSGVGRVSIGSGHRIRESRTSG